MFPEFFQHGLCCKEFPNHGLFGFFVLLVFLEFCFSCFLKMFPLLVLDQAQLTWLTHEKTASLKTLKKRTTRVPCSEESFRFSLGRYTSPSSAKISRRSATELPACSSRPAQLQAWPLGTRWQLWSKRLAKACCTPGMPGKRDRKKGLS